MHCAQQISFPQNQSYFETEPKFPVGSTYKMRCYPERTLTIVSATWIGHWVYQSSYQGSVVNTYAEHKLETLMLPEVADGECIVIAGFTSSDAIAVTHRRAFKVYANRDGSWNAREPLDVDLIAFVTPYVQAYFAAIPVPRYVPVAEYEIGLCYAGTNIPFKTVKIKGDSQHKAMEAGRKELQPGAWEKVVLISVGPNPDRAAFNFAGAA